MKKKQFAIRDQRLPVSNRGGTTLTEVLIALLAMSVGVVAVASLFPLSVLRSVQARQTTQATILRYNAESQLRVHPTLLTLQQGTTTRSFRRRRNYMVDPLGWHLVGEFDNNYKNNFGGPNNRITRTTGGFAGNTNLAVTAAVNRNWRDNAAVAVSLPDSWVPAYEDNEAEVPHGSNGTFVSVAGISTGDLQAIRQTITSGGFVRVTVFDPVNSVSQAYNPPANNINAATQQITLVPPLPANGKYYDTNPATRDLVRVKVEIFEQQYTWMLTVRNSSSGIPDVDVVTFFRREFSSGIGGEFVYPPDTNDKRTNFNPIEVNAAGTPSKDPQNNTIPNRRILINWNPAQDEKPHLNRGGYILDVENALWYRIQKIESLDEAAGSAVLVLEDNISKIGRLGTIIMRGVVEVFPLGSVVR